MNSYDVRFWQIETRKGKTVTYRVRWVVAGRQFSDSFTTKELAESYRAKLRAAARRGEGFNTETGLPESMVRALRDVSFYEHCAEFAAATWAVSAAKTRVSVIETLTRGVPVVVTDLKGAPEDTVLRSALRKQLNQGEHGGELGEDEGRAISWLARASRPVGSLADPAVVCDILDALTVNLNGKPAAPEYFSRRRRVMHRALAYAVRKKGSRSTRCPRPTCPRDGLRRRLLMTSSTRGRWAARRWSRRCSTRARRPAGGRAGGSPRSTAACSGP